MVSIQTRKQHMLEIPIDIQENLNTVIVKNLQNKKTVYGSMEVSFSEGTGALNFKPFVLVVICIGLPFFNVM